MSINQQDKELAFTYLLTFFFLPPQITEPRRIAFGIRSTIGSGCTHLWSHRLQHLDHLLKALQARSRTTILPYAGMRGKYIHVYMRERSAPILPFIRGTNALHLLKQQKCSKAEYENKQVRWKK